jgi:Zn finger protein HypA/HybF involved in hydrogenase expression
MAGEHPPPRILCTQCKKAFRPGDGIYGYMCPHCHSGQDTRSPDYFMEAP